MLLKKHPEIQPAVAEFRRLSLSEYFRSIADHKEKQRRDERAALLYCFGDEIIRIHPRINAN
ncbi:hypothetical protein AGMMS4952_25330 [Spirochaetia bacterium]|nr:hypothetical protein AGMMS4952_25330 [Spirochaetia bacterium]